MAPLSPFPLRVQPPLTPRPPRSFSQRLRCRHRPPNLYIEWSNFVVQASPFAEAERGSDGYSRSSRSFAARLPLPPSPAPSPAPITQRRKRPTVRFDMTLDLIPAKALPTMNRDKTPYPQFGPQSPSGPRSSVSSCCSFSSSSSSISATESNSSLSDISAPVAPGSIPPTDDHDTDTDEDPLLLDRARSKGSTRKFFCKLGKIGLVFLILLASWAAGAVLSLLAAVAFAVNVLLLMTAAAL